MRRLEANRILWAALSASAAVSALAMSACGKDETSARSPAKARPLSIEVTEPSPGRFRYRAPRSVRAGLVEISLENAGKARHKAQLMRVAGGHPIEEALKAPRPLPSWLTAAGGVGVTAPGATASVTQRLLPGTYYVTGSGNEKGKVAPLQVLPGEGGGELPRVRASITANEYSFTTSGLRPGRNQVELRDEGFEPHHAVLARMRRGSTLGDVLSSLRGERSGPPPIDIEKAPETAVIEEGQEQIVELDLRPGRYALLCFVSDREGGPPHVQRGMVDEVTLR